MDIHGEKSCVTHHKQPSVVNHNLVYQQELAENFRKYLVSDGSLQVPLNFFAGQGN